MKHSLTAFLACAILGFCFCGKDSEGPAGPPAGQTAFETDTMIVRHLLDTNGMTSLRYISVSGLTAARVTDLNLTHGNLQGGTITIIPASISGLTELQSLLLDSNQVSLLPSTIGSLVKLRTLSLNANLLTQLPAEIGSCTAISILKLNNNRLVALPASIVSLSVLTTLMIADNQITASGLPSGLSAMSTRTNPYPYLLVGGNRICNLQDAGLLSLLNTFAEPGWATLQTTCVP